MLAAGEVPAGFKDSGIDWLGDIPSHWEAGNIRRFAQMRTGHTPSRQVPEYWEDCSIPWFTLADVWQLRDGTRKYLGQTKEKISDLGLANSAAELLPPGTVILSRTASVGFSGIMPTAMATTQDFWNWVCGPKLSPDYLLWLFRAMGGKVSQITSGSTHKTIYQGDAASLEICVPPLETQRRIARFLDEKTARIDALIEKKRALLDRLAEKRQALITRAVTKGLNPQAAMKPSGIDWLGDIPAHWEVKRLKHISPKVSVGIVITPAAYYADDGVLAIRGLNVKPMSFDFTETRNISDDGHALHLKSELYEGDLVAVRTGDPGTTAVITRDLEGTNCVDLVIIRKPRKASSRFLGWFLNSDAARVQYAIGSEGALQLHFNVETSKEVTVSMPPLAEQFAIVDYVDRELEYENHRAAKVEQSVGLLEEYRLALITSAVTGRIAELQ